jgi:hypothetical protein
MTITLITLAALAMAGIIGSIVLVARDGYRRVPTRRA